MKHWKNGITLTFWAAALLCCGGANKEAASGGQAEEGDLGSAANSSSGESDEPAVEPQFEVGMSVLEARNAVPMNADRLSVEQDRLAEPLMDPATYEPCALKAQDHFTVKVAVWDGRAVGLDLSTKANNANLEECLIGVFRSLEWPDKVKSLNTVEYTY